MDVFLDMTKKTQKYWKIDKLDLIKINICFSKRQT